MMRGNRSLRGSQPPSPSGSEDDNESLKSPAGASRTADATTEGKAPSRGRKGKVDGAGADAMDVGA
jgi:hypothetical protein